MRLVRLKWLRYLFYETSETDVAQILTFLLAESPCALNKAPSFFSSELDFTRLFHPVHRHVLDNTHTNNQYLVYAKNVQPKMLGPVGFNDIKSDNCSCHSTVNTSENPLIHHLEHAR